MVSAEKKTWMPYSAISAGYGASTRVPAADETAVKNAGPIHSAARLTTTAAIRPPVRNPHHAMAQPTRTGGIQRRTGMMTWTRSLGPSSMNSRRAAPTQLADTRAASERAIVAPGTGARAMSSRTSVLIMSDTTMTAPTAPA